MGPQPQQAPCGNVQRSTTGRDPMSVRWMLLFASATALACGGGGAPPPPKNAAPPRPAARVIEVSRQVVTPHETSSVSELYERGEARARAGDLAAAAADLDRAYALDPNGPLAKDALFRAAEAWDLMKDNERA